MATLTYWYARCNNDSDCYSVVAKTKKEALAQCEKRGASDFDPPVKRVLFYKDAFDLFDWVTSEAGGRGCGEAK